MRERERKGWGRTRCAESDAIAARNAAAQRPHTRAHTLRSPSAHRPCLLARKEDNRGQRQRAKQREGEAAGKGVLRLQTFIPS